MEVATTQTDAEAAEYGLPSISIYSPKPVKDSVEESTTSPDKLPSLTDEGKRERRIKLSSKQNRPKPNLLTKSIMIKLRRKEIPPRYDDDETELESLSTNEDRRTPPYRFNKHYQKNSEVHSPVPFQAQRNTQKLEYYNSLVLNDKMDNDVAVEKDKQKGDRVNASPTKKSGVNFDLSPRHSFKGERDLKRIEDAYESVQMYRKIQREDTAMGVPRKLPTKKPKSILSAKSYSEFEKDSSHKTARDRNVSRVQSVVSRHTPAPSRVSIRGPDGHLSRASTSFSKFSSTQSQVGSTASPSRSSFHSVISSGYNFPKEKDFVSRDGTKIDNMGVDWNVFQNSELVESTRKSIEKLDTQAGKSTIPGKLCRNSNPVTDALLKEGVTVSKRKYNTLNFGQMNTAKVWKRSLDNPGVCLKQIAREDIPFSAIKHLIPTEKPPEKISLYAILKPTTA